MVKLFTALLGTETKFATLWHLEQRTSLTHQGSRFAPCRDSTFSPLPTGLGSYEDSLLVRGGKYGRLRGHNFAGPLIRWREKAHALGWEVVEGVAAFAAPAGNTTAACFNALRDEILGELRAAMPVDVVLLNLHGAMVAENSLDAEGELLSQVRGIVGPSVPLLAEPHFN